MNLRNSTTTTGLKQQIYPYQKNKKRFDEDGVSGFINPIMIDEKYQGNHYAENAMTIAIDILKMRRVQPKHQQPLNSSKLCFVHLTNSQQMNQNHILI